MASLHRTVTRRAVLAAGALMALSAGLGGCGGSSAASQDDPSDGSSPNTSPDIAEITDSPAQPGPSSTPTRPERTLAAMTLEQKVAQLFCVTPEQLTGASVATVSGPMTADALARIPVGGLVYFSHNIVGDRQLRDMLAGADRLSRASGAGVGAFLSVDEEGGPLVARVANSGLFDVPTFPNMSEIGATGDASRAAEVGSTIGGYLADIGFNLDFAPDADVLTNPDNPVIGPRSFGSDPQLVAQMVAAQVEAMLAVGVAPCVKHFPGHGDTMGDSHTGAVYTERSRDEIEACEFEPYRAAIEAVVPMVMVGHIETPNFAADGLPASLSPIMMGDVLRGELGFDGIIISDSFSMGAITQRFMPDEAAVQFFAAGGDMLLMPADLTLAYNGALEAIGGGVLTEARIDESVMRILNVKDGLGLLP